MPVVNFAQRDRMLIKCIIGVRYETSPEQLRYLLARIRRCFWAIRASTRIVRAHGSSASEPPR